MPRFRASILSRPVGAIGVSEWGSVEFTAADDADLVVAAIDAAYQHGREHVTVRKIVRDSRGAKQMRTRSKARPTCTRGPASAHAAANVEIMEINFPTILNERGLVDDAHYSKGALMELRRHPDTGECLITIYRADDGIEVRGEWPDWRHWRAVAEQRGNALQEIIDARPAGDVYPGDGWSGAHEKFAAYARAALGRDHQQSPRDNKTTELSTAITTIARQQQEIDHLARHFNALIAEHRTAAATLRAAHYSAAADEMEQHCAMYELVANNPSVTPEPR